MIGEFLLRFVIVGGLLGLIDGVWIKYVMGPLYRSSMGNFLLERPQMIPALLFYVIYVSAIIFFVLMPALEKDSWLYALGAGAFFGLAAYGTYGLTNLAVFKGFTAKVVAIDVIWGTVLTSLVSVLAFMLLKWLGQ